MRWTVAIDGLVTSRSTWDRKLSVTPARSATSRRVRWRAWRSDRMRVPELQFGDHGVLPALRDFDGPEV